MTMENSEKPITRVVTHSITVFQNTLSFFRVANSAQKHRASSATMKNRAPLLYGRPKPFTKMRSKKAASFGRYGMNRNTSRASITTPMRKITASCLNGSCLSSFFR